jgi:hypothetical protein
LRGFEGVFKHDFARGAQTVTVSKVQNFFGQDKQAIYIVALLAYNAAL